MKQVLDQHEQLLKQQESRNPVSYTHLDVYSIYADMVTKGYSEYDHHRPYHCVYCGRRDHVLYKHTHNEIATKYQFDLVMCERMPDILSGAMGNFTYTCLLYTSRCV